MYILFSCSLLHAKPFAKSSFPTENSLESRRVVSIQTRALDQVSQRRFIGKYETNN